MYSYVCPDLVKEYAKYDAKPEKYFKEYRGVKVGNDSDNSCKRSSRKLFISAKQTNLMLLKLVTNVSLALKSFSTPKFSAMILGILYPR
jgi:hypothetical protein